MTDKERDMIYIHKLSIALKLLKEVQNEISKDEGSL